MGTFDLLYPTSHGILANTDLFGWRNLRHLRTSLEFKPYRRLGLNFDYHTLKLASRFDGLYNTSGSAIVKAPKGGTLSSDVGQEVDGYLKYGLRANINVGGGLRPPFRRHFSDPKPQGQRCIVPILLHDLPVLRRQSRL